MKESLMGCVDFGERRGLEPCRFCGGGEHYHREWCPCRMAWELAAPGTMCDECPGCSEALELSRNWDAYNAECLAWAGL